MEYYWEIERSRALLEEDTPQFREHQFGFLRHVVQPNNYHWMSEPINSTFAQHKEIGRCVICDGNHPSDQCIYISEWRNYWNHFRYEEPSHFTEPYHPSYPSSTSDLHQEPERYSPKEKHIIREMVDILKKCNEK